MCGICGFLKTGGRGEPETLRSMMGTMVHRGPDDSGIYMDEGGIGLGHRRLSIIDLSESGRQPMANEDGTVRTMCNGEIYNFKELKQELEGLGHDFRGACDAEVIPHAYEEWGDEFPARLRGMFAIALWDGARERLMLVRDRLGIKPLYYFHKGDLFLFASELKALAAYAGHPREVNPKSLYYYLSFGYVPSPMAIFNDTGKVPPAHVLFVDRHGITERRYWDPLTVSAGLSLPSKEEGIMEMMDQVLRESVRYRLISDVPLGAFLSGGIDSSLTVAIMTRLASGPVRTFTIGFWEKDYDEAGHARRIADYLGTEHTELYVEPEDALKVIPLLPKVYDEPFGDSSAIPTYLVSRLARQSVTVALSGDGGDELFCGYPRYYWFHLARPLSILPRPVRGGLRPIVGRLLHPKARKAATWLTFEDFLELYFGMVGIWRRGALKEMMGFELPYGTLPFGRVYEESGRRHHLEKLMLVDLSTYLPDDILTKVDRASMAHSLEARVPLLDHRFVELALGIPLGMKFRKRQGKYLLKRLLSRYLPSELYDRPKMGFGAPLDRWFRGELKELLLDYTAPDRLKREGFFAPRLIGEMVGEHLSGKRNHQYALWALLSFQMWLEEYR